MTKVKNSNCGKTQTVTVVIVTLVIVTVAVGTVVIVTSFSKNNLTLQKPMRDVLGADCRDSHPVFLGKCFLKTPTFVNLLETINLKKYFKIYP